MKCLGLRFYKGKVTEEGREKIKGLADGDYMVVLRNPKPRESKNQYGGGPFPKEALDSITSQLAESIIQGKMIITKRKSCLDEAA